MGPRTRWDVTSALKELLPGFVPGFLTLFLLTTFLPSVRSYQCLSEGYQKDFDKLVKLGVILPKWTKYPWIMEKTAPAIEYAVDSVKNRTDLLPGFDFSITYGDSQCSETYGPLVAIDMYLKNQAHVFLGPVCDYSVAPIARFSPHWNIPLITAGGLVHAFEDKNQYKLLTRILGSYAKLGEFVHSVFQKFNWTTSALIYHNNLGQHVTKGRSDCFFIMEAIYLALQVEYKRVYPNKDIWYKAFDENLKDQYNITSILADASLNGRSKWPR